MTSLQNNLEGLLCAQCGGRTEPILKSWSELSGKKLKEPDEGEVEAALRANLTRMGLSKKQQESAVRDERERTAKEKLLRSKPRCRCDGSRWAWFKRVVLRHQEEGGLMRAAVFLSTLAACVLSACVNVAPVGPGAKAIALESQQTGHYFGGGVVFPKGRYEPQFANAGGTYFKAPSSLILQGAGASAPTSGGLFIPTNSSHKQGFWIEDRGAQTVSIAHPVTFHYAP